MSIGDVPSHVVAIGTKICLLEVWLELYLALEDIIDGFQYPPPPQKNAENFNFIFLTLYYIHHPYAQEYMA